MKAKNVALRLHALGVLCGSGMCFGEDAGSVQYEKPNILFIVVDDLGWNDVQYLPDVKSPYLTPNIERLAGRGMVFSEAYASCPVCSPTRASLLTGKSPAALKLTAHIPVNIKYDPTPQGTSVLPAETADHLKLEEVTFAELLKKDGYTTGFFGKWHLAGEGTANHPDKKGVICPEFDPQHQGFDINIGGCAYGMPPSYFSPYKNATISDGPKGEYLTDRLTDEAISFIKNHNKGPFLAYLCYYAVHIPLQAKPELIQQFKTYGDRAVYAAMIASVDENIGRLMSALDSEGISENTIIILTSDNGGLQGNAPLRGRKGDLWEGGIRVPLLISWPKQVAKRTVCNVPVISYDFLPTLLDMTGSAQSVPAGVEGRSIYPLLENRSDFVRGTPLFWHYPHYHHDGGPMGAVVRDGFWKMIYSYKTGKVMLFNWEKDPFETEDLAGDFPEKAGELKNRLFKWLKQVDANMPIPVADEGR